MKECNTIQRKTEPNKVKSNQNKTRWKLQYIEETKQLSNDIQKDKFFIFKFSKHKP